MVISPELLSTSIALRYEHRLLFTRDVFALENEVLADVLTPFEAGEPVRVVVFWDAGLAVARPDFNDTIRSWFARHSRGVRLAVDPICLRGGEQAKNDFAQLEQVWQALHEAALCRHSYVVAIGGGALLDLVGFAAATAHRGIPLVRVPTTSLSQGDGGIGVKNGVNRFGKKNWLGAFTVPHAVINDSTFLHELPARERRAGLIEAVKVALIRDAGFFEMIATQVPALAECEPEALEAVIRESARQHLEHITTAGDPFERGSARPLDFGHWSAHKLEQLSEFRLSHGEAVAIGLALDLRYSARIGLLPELEADRVLRVISELGFPCAVPELEQRDAAGRRRVFEGLDEFREHMGGRLTIPLVRAPGQRTDVHEIDFAQMDAAIDELRRRHG